MTVPYASLLFESTNSRTSWYA